MRAVSTTASVEFSAAEKTAPSTTDETPTPEQESMPTEKPPRKKPGPKPGTKKKAAAKKAPAKKAPAKKVAAKSEGGAKRTTSASVGGGTRARKGRRVRANNKADIRPEENGQVQTRSMNRPKRGYTEADAIEMVRVGYSVEHIEQRTGFAARWLNRQTIPDKPLAELVGKKLA